MSNQWNQWQDHIVDGKFPLLRHLGGNDPSAIFATQYQDNGRLVNAAIKLVPATPESGENLLARWQESSELSHPSLISLFDSGWANLGGTQYAYLVMELAEENLGQVLPSRALDPTEALQTADAVLNVLSYLHSKGFVHGSIRPANILASGDQLKLSNDSLYRAGEVTGNRKSSTAYTAPENSGSASRPAPLSMASDVWSLGATLVETLAQTVPSNADAKSDPAIPRTVPEPFLEIAQHCLVRDPQRRWNVAQISDRLHNRVPARPAAVAVPKVAAPESAAPPVKSPEPARTPEARPVPKSAPAPLAATQRRVNPPPSPVAQRAGRPKQKKSFGLPLAIGCAVVFGAILVTPRFFRRPVTAPDSSAIAASSPEAATAVASAPVTSAKPENPAPRKSSSTPTNQNPEREQLTAEAPSAKPALAHPESINGEATNTVARSGMDAAPRGEIIHRAMPEVLQSAVRSIHGTVRVIVKVNVDREGNIEDAELAARGPSKYFAHAAVQAARQWKFRAPQVGGRGVLSSWILEFEFTRDGTNVVPRQELP